MKEIGISQEYIETFIKEGLTDYLWNGTFHKLNADQKNIVRKIEMEFRVIVYYAIKDKIKIKMTGSVYELLTFLCVDRDAVDTNEEDLLKEGYHITCEWNLTTNSTNFVLTRLTVEDGKMSRKFNKELVEQL